MTLNRTNFVLASLLVFITIVALMSRVDYGRPNLEVLPDMKYTSAATTYSKNAVFANGRTLQVPVSGTIARGHLPFHFLPTKEDAVRAGEVLQNPYLEPARPEASALDALTNPWIDSVARGGEVYRTYCVPCHGGSGAGDGHVALRGFPPPPSLLTGLSRQMKDGQLFHILTHGQNAMPDFRAQLSADQRWSVINFIRDLQAAVPAQPEPAADTGSVIDPPTALD